MGEPSIPKNVLLTMFLAFNSVLCPLWQRSSNSSLFLNGKLMLLTKLMLLDIPKLSSVYKAFWIFVLSLGNIWWRHFNNELIFLTLAYICTFSPKFMPWVILSSVLQFLRIWSPHSIVYLDDLILKTTCSRETSVLKLIECLINLLYMLHSC